MGVTPYRLKNGQKRWRADTWIKHRDGTAERFVKHGLPSKEMAQRLLDKVRLDAFEGRHFERQKRERITVKELWEIYEPVCKARNRGWPTEIARAKHFIDHLGTKKASRLSIDDVSRYRDARSKETFGKGKTPTVSTINRELSQLRRLLNFGVQTGKLERNPLMGIRGLIIPEDNAREEWIDEREFAQLYEKADAYLRPILLVAYDCGMRKGEILNLRWSQLDLRGEGNGVIRLTSGDTKSRKPREVPLTGRVRTAIDGLPRSLSGYVFTNPETGTRWNQIKKAFQRARHAADLDHIRFHDLRRSFVTNARKRGLPESVIMRISGHKTRAVFERYNIVNDDDVRNAVQVIEAGQRAELEAAKKKVFGSNMVNCGSAAPLNEKTPQVETHGVIQDSGRTRSDSNARPSVP